MTYDSAYSTALEKLKAISMICHNEHPQFVQDVPVHPGANDRQRQASEIKLSRAFFYLCSVKSADAREQCVRVLPMMTEILAGNLRNLAQVARSVETVGYDSDFAVRLALAEVFPSVVRGLLVGKSMGQVTRILVVLLRDPAQRVRDTTLLQLDDVVDSYDVIISSKKERASHLKELCKAACSALNSTGNSNVVDVAAKAICALVKKNLGDSFMLRVAADGFLALLRNSVCYDVHRIAVKAVIKCSSFAKRAEMRDSMIAYLLALLDSEDAHVRRLIVECAEEAFDTYSPELFDRLFATHVFELARDPDLDVRLSVAQLIPRLIAWCQGHEGLEPALQLLRADNSDAMQMAMANHIWRAGRCVQQRRRDSAVLTERRMAEKRYGRANVARNGPTRLQSLKETVAALSKISRPGARSSRVHIARTGTD